jgi:hypothetical protein
MKQFSVLVNGNEMERHTTEEAARQAMADLADAAGARAEGRVIGDGMVPAAERSPGFVDGYVLASKYHAPWGGSREVWQVVEWDDEAQRTVVEPDDEDRALEYVAELSDRAAGAIEPFDTLGYGPEYGAGEGPEPYATLIEALNAQWGYNGWGWWPQFAEWLDQAIDQVHGYEEIEEL